MWLGTISCTLIAKTSKYVRKVGYILQFEMKAMVGDATENLAMYRTAVFLQFPNNSDTIALGGHLSYQVSSIRRNVVLA